MSDDASELELVVPAGDLEFRVSVPAGCVIVAALRLPSGQLIELSDLVAEDAAGIPVAEVRRSGAGWPPAPTGPVDEDKVRAAKDAERRVMDAMKGPGRGKKHALADITHPVSPEAEQQAVRDALRAKMVVPDKRAPDPKLCECAEVLVEVPADQAHLVTGRVPHYSPELSPDFLELPKDED